MDSGLSEAKEPRAQTSPPQRRTDERELLDRRERLITPDRQVARERSIALHENDVVSRLVPRRRQIVADLVRGCPRDPDLGDVHLVDEVRDRLAVFEGGVAGPVSG
jgi:hypothetical protein